MSSHRYAHPLPVYIALAAVMSIMLTGCGVKPTSLSKPSGSEDSSFPRTYPDSETDQE